MPEAVFGINLFPLQAYFVEDDPMQARIVIIAVVVIIAVAIVFRFVNRGGKSPVASGGGSFSAAKRYSGFSLRRAAAPYGLDGEQIKLLDYVFRNDNVSDPPRVLKDSAGLDRHFRRAYKNIVRDSGGSDRMQQNLSKLYILRNTIEAAPVEDDVSSSMPVENTEAVIKYGNDSYAVRIYFSNNRNIITEIPRSPLGTSLKIGSGTNVTLTYLSRSNNSYSLICSYVGIEKTESGPGFRMTSNSRPRPLTKRQYRRRRIDIRCEFYFVQAFESGKGRNKTTRLVVSPRKFNGVIRDISAGGCSIKTPVPVQAASRLKIGCFISGKEQTTVLGQVMRSNRSATVSVLHIKFIKVPMRAYNAINTLVFGFNEKRQSDTTGLT
jgi:hypothetical protein